MTDDKGSNRSNAYQRGLVPDPKQLCALDWSAQLKLCWGGHWDILGRLLLFLGKPFPLLGLFPARFRPDAGGDLFRMVRRGFPTGHLFGRAGWVIFKSVLYSCRRTAERVCLTQRCFSSALLARLFSLVVEGQISVLFKIFIRLHSAAFLNDRK